MRYLYIMLMVMFSFGCSTPTTPQKQNVQITITFDDGRKGVFTYAYPMLNEYGLIANVSKITGITGNDWNDIMSVSQLNIMKQSGWSIIAHSQTHPFLTQLTPDSAWKEISDSRRTIQRLNFSDHVFIIPYLDYNDRILTQVQQAGFRYARCCVQDSWNTDTLLDWPIVPGYEYRLVGVDITDYGQPSTYNFKTVTGRENLRFLLSRAIRTGKFVDVMFHNITSNDTTDLRKTLEILSEYKPYITTYDKFR